MVDFYDDSIRDFDNYVKEIVGHLKEVGKFDSTIIVITSDHGKKRTTHHRLPLMIRFPKGEHKGVIKDNSQRLDIAPTILDYLGEEVPQWMDGKSLLEENTGKFRPIYSAFTKRPDQFAGGLWAVADRSPPFYSLGALAVIVCDRWYKLSLKTGSVEVRPVKGHTQICRRESMPDVNEAKEKLLDLLQRSGYRIPDGKLENLIREEA